MTLYVSISADQKRRLLGHAEECRPNESCAVLLGRYVEGGVAVTEIIPARNADMSTTSFAIPDAELVKIYGRAEEAGLDVVAIFHSHPFSGAYPSATDLRFMESNPVVWIISGSSGEMRAFTLDQTVREVRIVAA